MGWLAWDSTLCHHSTTTFSWKGGQDMSITMALAFRIKMCSVSSGVLDRSTFPRQKHVLKLMFFAETASLMNSNLNSIQQLQQIRNPETRRFLAYQILNGFRAFELFNSWGGWLEPHPLPPRDQTRQEGCHLHLWCRRPFQEASPTGLEPIRRWVRWAFELRWMPLGPHFPYSMLP